MVKSRRQCLRVAELRKEGFTDLRDWLSHKNNMHVLRNGRIFIHKDGEKEIFHYPRSPWHNPFTLKEYTLDESLRLYREHIGRLVAENKLHLEELRGKTLGCYCETDKCHAGVLVELVNAS
jgi:hypothetical protein